MKKIKLNATHSLEVRQDEFFNFKNWLECELENQGSIILFSGARKRFNYSSIHFDGLNVQSKFDELENSEYDINFHEAFTKSMKRKGFSVLPLWAYEHSGVSFSTGKTCSWDSSAIGYIVLKDSEFNIESFLNELDNICNGETYIVDVIKNSICQCCGATKDSDQIDTMSCIGDTDKTIAELTKMYKDAA